MDANSELAIRAALGGQTILVVGGHRQSDALARLQTGLGLGAIAHCETRKADASPRAFESQLRRPGLLLAIWVLGLSRTQHGEHLHAACRELGIPFIDCRRIPQPHVLVARLGALRLGTALERRADSLRTAAASIGGAA